MGRYERSKGLRIERVIVNLHLDEGVPAERVPLSGAAGGSFKGDIVIKDEWRAEVKARGAGSGFTLLERWLEGNDILFLRRDGERCPYVFMSWDTYIALMKG